MNPTGRAPRKRALVFASCLALLGLGVITLVPGDQSSTRRGVSIAAANPVAVDDTIVPPHREPPPPPPPAPPAPPPPRPTMPAASFRASILEALSGSTAGGQTIYVEVEGLGTVVSTNGSTMGIPASLTKLYTGGAAMLRLGNDARLKTEVLTEGVIAPDGTLNGSLVLVGGGDPTLRKADLQSLAAGVYAAGVRRVGGDLYADDSRFDRARAAPGWRPFYFPDDVGTLSALAVDGNTWRTDPAFYADPALGNLELFRALLAESGITVTGGSRLGRPDGKAMATLLAHNSAPLEALLGEMMTKSDNFYAEMFLKELGRSAGNPTTAGGVEVIASVARELGVAHGRFFDGSGLSIDNRESPVHIVEWLKAVDASPVGDAYRSSLARPCSGSKYLLEKRLCGTPAVGRIQAKTGTLLRSRSLAGYATTASGRKVWFAIMLADVQSNQRAWEAFDRALVSIASFAR